MRRRGTGVSRRNEVLSCSYSWQCHHRPLVKTEFLFNRYNVQLFPFCRGGDRSLERSNKSSKGAHLINEFWSQISLEFGLSFCHIVAEDCRSNRVIYSEVLIAAQLNGNMIAPTLIGAGVGKGFGSNSELIH